MMETDQARQARFLELFAEHEDSLKLFVRSQLFSRDEERDVMQDVAAALWQKFDVGQDRPAFRRWAFGVARMALLSFRRDRARDRLTFGDEVFELWPQSVLEHADALESEGRAVDICVQKLPDYQRTLVQRAYAPVAKIDELALQLGRTAMSLCNTLHRIRLYPHGLHAMCARF